jgi:hypothetical protein
MFKADSFELSKEYQTVLKEQYQARDVHFFLPIEKATESFSDSPLLKSKNKDEDEDANPFSWRFCGMASSATKDLEGDFIFPSAFGNCEYFLRSGFYNENHVPGAAGIIGIPLAAKVTKNGLWVAGYLLKSNPNSKAYWDLMKTFSKHNHMGRRVGLSIEGKELERDEDGNITRVWLKAIAITVCPVNTETYAEVMTPEHEKKYLSKSLNDESSTSSSNIADKEVSSVESGVKKLDENKEADVDKALEAGYSTDQTNQTGGEALRVQSLDRNLKVETNDEESKCLDGTENKVNMTPLVKHAMEKALFSDPKDAEKLIDYARILVENGLI